MKKILVFDDNIWIYRSIIEKLLNFYSVKMFKCQDDVLNELRNSILPDLCIIDIMMPIGNLKDANVFNAGMKFYEQMIAPKYPNIPILFWSNYSENDWKEIMADNKYGNIYFLEKSFEPLDLIVKVHEILKVKDC